MRSVRPSGAAVTHPGGHSLTFAVSVSGKTHSQSLGCRFSSRKGAAPARPCPRVQQSRRACRYRALGRSSAGVGEGPEVLHLSRLSCRRQRTGRSAPSRASRFAHPPRRNRPATRRQPGSGNPYLSTTGRRSPATCSTRRCRIHEPGASGPPEVGTSGPQTSGVRPPEEGASGPPNRHMNRQRTVSESTSSRCDPRLSQDTPNASPIRRARFRPTVDPACGS